MGAVIGALAGAAAAFLLTPMTGAEARKQLKQKLEEGRVRADLAMKEGRDLLGEADDRMDDAKDSVRHAAHVAKDGVRHVAHEAKEKINDLRKKDA